MEGPESMSNTTKQGQRSRRMMGEATNKKIAGRQHFKCANKPESNLKG